MSAAHGVHHGFFGRQGGVSGGIYASLNCGLGSEDDVGAILENRARLAATMGVTPQRLINPYQHHSADVVTVTAPWTWNDIPEADACVTTVADLAIAVSTADCVPVLFADADAGVIGAAHAGWRGAVGGVLANTVTAMEALGARRVAIRAAVGPCIRQASYQVGDDLRETFLASNAETARHFAPDPCEAGKWRFDLAGFVCACLDIAGVGTVDDVGLDTYPDEDHFFSYRRATHRGEADYGRSLAAIALTSDA